MCVCVCLKCKSPSFRSPSPCQSPSALCTLSCRTKQPQQNLSVLRVYMLVLMDHVHISLSYVYVGSQMRRSLSVFTAPLQESCSSRWTQQKMVDLQLDRGSSTSRVVPSPATWTDTRNIQSARTNQWLLNETFKCKLMTERRSHLFYINYRVSIFQLNNHKPLQTLQRFNKI